MEYSKERAVFYRGMIVTETLQINYSQDYKWLERIE